MKAKSLLLTVFFFVSVNSIYGQGPVWEWAKGAGGVAGDYGLSNTVDSSGNIYVTGWFFSPTITFGNTTLVNANAGTDDIFIAKYDAGGNALWAKSFGGSADDQGYSIITDASGNVYLTGPFRSPTLTIGTTTLTNHGGGPDTMDFFIAKCDANGNVIWALSGGGTDIDYSRNIVADKFGNIFITGAFTSSSIYFGNTTLVNSGFYDFFVAKYDSSGSLLWARGAAGGNDEAGVDLDVDANGSLYVIGSFNSDSITFGTIVLYNGGVQDVFIVKLATDGVPIWATTVGSSSYGRGIAISNSGNFYVTGEFNNNLILGNDTLINKDSLFSDIFIAKYDASATVIWAKSVSGNDKDYSFDIYCDAHENAYITGEFFSSACAFNSIILSNLDASKNTSDFFLAKYDSGGSILFAKSCGGNLNDLGWSIASNAKGDIYVAGYSYSPVINFGNISLVSSGQADMFLAKLSSIVGVFEPFENNNSVNFFPNPAHSKLTVTFHSLSATHLALTDLTGRLIIERSLTPIPLSKGEGALGATVEIDVSGVAKGVYVVTVGEARGKVVIN